MSTRTHNFRIGLFVLAGAALLVVALFATTDPVMIHDAFGKGIASDPVNFPFASVCAFPH